MRAFTKYLIIIFFISNAVFASLQSIDTKKSKIFFNTYNEGDNKIILVHGGPGMHGYMSSLIPILPKKTKVIEYYQRTFSHKLSKSFEMQDHAYDLNQLIKSLNDSKIALIGHSWGTNIILSYLARYQEENIKKVILISPAPLDYLDYQFFYKNVIKASGNDKKVKDFVALWQKYEKRSNEDEYKLHQKWFKMILPYYFVENKDKNAKEIESLLLSKASDWRSVKLSSKSFYSKKENKLIKELKKAKSKLPKITLIYGAKDVFPASRTSEKLKNILKTDDIIELDNTGHCPWLDKDKAEFKKALNQRLRN